MSVLWLSTLVALRPLLFSLHSPSFNTRLMTQQRLRYFAVLMRDCWTLIRDPWMRHYTLSLFTSLGVSAVHCSKHTCKRKRRETEAPKDSQPIELMALTQGPFLPLLPCTQPRPSACLSLHPLITRWQWCSAGWTAERPNACSSSRDVLFAHQRIQRESMDLHRGRTVSADKKIPAQRCRPNGEPTNYRFQLIALSTGVTTNHQVIQVTRMGYQIVTGLHAVCDSKRLLRSES